jgi:Putative esterase
MIRSFIGKLKKDITRRLGPLFQRHSYRMAGSVRVIPAPAAESHPGNSEYPADQCAQIEISAAAAGRTRWTGVAVRIGEGGRRAYVGACNMANGKMTLVILKKIDNKWTRLGNAYVGDQHAEGTRLSLMAVGSTIAFMENDTMRIATGDDSLSSGAPGIIADDVVAATKLSAGPAGSEIRYMSSDARDIATYCVISATNSGGPRVLRVLRPDNPAPGMVHNFLFVLPVEEELRTTYGNGLQELQSLDAQNKHNLTIIEPTFGSEPWYADNPCDAGIRYETFMTAELVPWVRENLAMTGREQNWLIGFSKSGLGGHGLLLRHPDLFSLAASWDFPADISSHDEYGPGSAACYGTDVSFQSRYRLTNHFVKAHKTPFAQDCRIWIGKGQVFADNVSRYESVLASEGVRYLTGGVLDIPHRWDTGWVSTALLALQKCSAGLPQENEIGR